MLLIGPVDIQCNDLAILASIVIVDAPQKWELLLSFCNRITTTARNDVSSRDSEHASLSASWPGVENYPWNNFATQPRIAQTGNPLMDEAQHRFRRFISEFRARGKGQLARSRVKLENTRMTKGTGQAVLMASCVKKS